MYVCGHDGHITMLLSAAAIINEVKDDHKPICCFENFGKYMEKYKGFIAFIGIRNKNKGVIYPCHQPKFDIDEAILKEGAKFFAEYGYNFLDKTEL